MKFYIKTGIPKWSEAERWGDYHFAHAMKAALEARGHQVRIQILPEWDGPEDADSDVTVHLMGLSLYKAKKGPLNVLWLISHPEMVPKIHLDQYDLILVASRPFVPVVQRVTQRPVVPLLQFADTRWMYPDPRPDRRATLLFVGNSRKVHRKILRDLLPCEYDLHVWGERWEGLIPQHLVKGVYYPYERVRELYSSCAILLNDHWDDMRRHGFVSNRIFDALACRAFVLSDPMEEIDALFDGAVATYETPEDLRARIRFFLDHPEERRTMAEKGYRIVTGEHTAEKRMEELLEILRKMDRPALEAQDPPPGQNGPLKRFFLSLNTWWRR
ncbi:MAG: hypothetical protein JG766_1022 [Desulfacinum sp.]|jgi:hypothetical protein|nr:hypothetical protein [Desulfacinum sp.]